jgi:hypothetical protein
MRFLSLEKSTKPDKKYVIKFTNPNKTIHFGSKNSLTYLDHHDKTKRENYILRHKVREDWTKINAGSLSRYLLWGDSTNLQTNLTTYLKKFLT